MESTVQVKELPPNLLEMLLVWRKIQYPQPVALWRDVALVSLWSSIMNPLIDVHALAVEEVVITYDPPTPISETALQQCLHTLDPWETSIKEFLKASHCVAVQLGSCAADLILRHSITDLGYATSYHVGSGDGDVSSDLSDVLLNIRNAVKSWRYPVPNIDASSDGFNVTPKFLELYKILKCCEPYGQSFRGVVFG